MPGAAPCWAGAGRDPDRRRGASRAGIRRIGATGDGLLRRPRRRASLSLLGQTSTKLSCAQVPAAFGRNMRHGLSSIPIPVASQQRPAARLHELAGGRLPGHLARDDPALDGCRAHKLLQDARRTAAVLARPARGLHRLDASRRPGRPRRRGPPRAPASRLISWLGARTSPAACGRRTSGEAGRSSRSLRRTAHRSSHLGGSRPPGDRPRPRRAACERGSGS